MSAQIRRFVNDLSNAVQQTKTALALKLASGSTATMEQYQRQVGRIEGLENGVALARDMLGQLEAAGDNDKLPEMPVRGVK